MKVQKESSEARRGNRKKQRKGSHGREREERRTNRMCPAEGDDDQSKADDSHFSPTQTRQKDELYSKEKEPKQPAKAQTRSIHASTRKAMDRAIVVSTNLVKAVSNNRESTARTEQTWAYCVLLRKANKPLVGTF